MDYPRTDSVWGCGGIRGGGEVNAGFTGFWLKAEES